ncbi:DUF4252 domain-containing protein [Penaeicola halotolerans]|uniref:DUF4252 domain-containing protein n=1 Tax=Penaeicola halotolerans TaxID=2793196 RepID=UPI001CF8C2E8|nr:DUF4252 domain-containing protein [Penaeicola halotolerans]
MKKLGVLMGIMLMTYGAIAQSKSVAGLFEKYRSDENAFHLELGGSFLNMLNGMNANVDEDLAILAKTVEKISFIKLPEGSFNKANFETLRKGIKRESMELMMEVNDEGTNVEIFTKGTDKIIKEMIFLLNDGESYSVLSIRGEIDVDKAGKLQSNLSGLNLGKGKK